MNNIQQKITLSGAYTSRSSILTSITEGILRECPYNIPKECPAGILKECLNSILREGSVARTCTQCQDGGDTQRPAQSVMRKT